MSVMSLVKLKVLKKAAVKNLPKIIRPKAARISDISILETERNLANKIGSNGRCALCPK